MDDFLNRMKLPKGSEKEDLEQISKDKLRPLFDSKKFQIREEMYRDKGVDFDIELKFNGNYTNFRFLIQLKATNTIECNTDKSYSKSIDTSNIQYLLNSGKPSYYILYHEKSKEFYYSNLGDFLKTIGSKEKDWNKQKTNTLRFEKRFNKEVTDKIYQTVLDHGKNFRKLNEKIALSTKDNFGKISITDENLNFYSENELRDQIEQHGLGLINEGNSKLIIKASHSISKNLYTKHPKFNLVLAMAHYHTGNMLESLSNLKDSGKYLNKLEKEDLSLHQYFMAAVKYSLGLLNNREYSDLMDSIEGSSLLQYYIKIEKLSRKHEDNSHDYSLNSYKKELDKILNNKDVPATIINLAQIEYYKFWSLDINIRNLQNLMLLSKEIYSPEVIESGQQITNQITEIQSFHENLRKKIVVDKDYFNYWLLETHRINYHFEAFFIDAIINGENATIISGVEFLLSEVRKIKNKYLQIGHIENQIVCMSYEYEMLEFLNERVDLERLKKEICDLLELYELRDLKRRFDLIQNGSTKLSRLKDFYEESKESYDKTVKKVKSYMEKVAAFDKEDKNRQNLLPSEVYSVELFPLGVFSFSKENLHEFYKILGIEEAELKTQLENMFLFVIPRLNLFKPKIVQEGFLNGILEYEGISSWKLAYERRKKLFEGKFIKRDL
ncbi:DUF4365 domain-containing protein [Muricauda oceani]|uniref:DUF4365 domain-containing protein n=1 Tax=Flagellimonas oceani TaxID=2698672 RepID=A0A6G7J2J8_9FLAO|nr:DUF4365 domain-containing protein [Allomuricauda oceani]MBW8244019.1 DUF4365 domain-containing protein [Allomuricauda oceani]QII44996.1 DUF4365 domain-containing protein [Allomuricauda oceani]